MKLLGGFVVLVLTGLSVFVGIKSYSFSLAAGAANDSVKQVAISANNEIQKSAVAVTEAGKNTTSTAEKAKLDIQKVAEKLSSDTASFKKDIAASRGQLAEAARLAPEIHEIQGQLNKATQAIQEQQKTLSSTEDFTRKVFSAHTNALFALDQPTNPNVIVVPPAGGKGNAHVYMLLPSSPVPGTVQLQWNIFVQLPNTYLVFQNLVMFAWGESVDALKTKPISVSYFADSKDKDIIKTLSLRDGRVFADDQPMPKFGEVDPDFRGNKWMPAPPKP